MCSSLVPEGVQREDNGTGSGAGASGGAARRAAAKREGERLDGLNRAGKKKAKQEERAKGAADATQQAVRSVIEGMSPLLSSMAPAPLPPVVPVPPVSRWREKTDEAESKAAAIALSGDILTAHGNFLDKLRDEENRGPGGNEKRIAYLKKKIAALEKEMDEE